MKPHLLRSITIFITFSVFSSCAHQFPPSSKYFFSDHVLQGLAEQKAEDVIQELKLKRDKKYLEDRKENQPLDPLISRVVENVSTFFIV